MPFEPSGQEANAALSQDAVEARLSDAAHEQSPAAAAPATPAMPAPADRSARRFEFHAPSFLTAAELRQLRLRHDEFLRALMTRLSVYLRLEVGAQLVTLQTVGYRRWVEHLAAPTHLTLFRVEPLNGLGVLAVPLPLGRALVDRLLGGPGQPANVERDFTEIESEVLDLALQLVLKEWAQEVTRQPEVRPQVVSHESHPRYLPWNDPEANLLVATVNVTMHDLSTELQLAVPSAMLEGVQRQLHAPADTKPALSSARSAGPPAWHPGLDELPVAIHAAWAELEITARELAQLKVGDVLQVAPQQVNRVQVCIGRQPKFYGRLGTAERTWAVELTSVI